MSEPEIVVVGRKPDAFDKALPFLLRHEGGYVNNRDDPGGMTNLGVTRRVWEDWTDDPADECEMRALTPADVAPLYRAQYWNATRCDDLPPALAMCVFDFAVNAGVRRAGKLLQALVGVPQDGWVGPATITAATRWVGEHGAAQAVHDYQQLRRGFYRKLPKFPIFGRGWLRRVDEVEHEAVRLAA